MDQGLYSYSRLSSQAMGSLVAMHYDLPEFWNCRFYVLGLHDNYLIESSTQKYILRLYRNDWRSNEEVNFELDLLAFLSSQCDLVASPLLSKTGGKFFVIDSPEGKRAAALFKYADGYAPENNISIEESTLLGTAIANIHRISNTFSTPHHRPILDIPYLLDDSLIAIAPFLDVDARTYLGDLQSRLKDNLAGLSKELHVFGICIGDVNPSNFHINENKQITVFDFDQCGYGYRAFEIGKYISSIHYVKRKQEVAHAFIDGYQQIFKLSKAELEAIPYFEMLAVIWVLAINVYNAERTGHKFLEKTFWDRRVNILKELDNAILSKQNLSTD